MKAIFLAFVTLACSPHGDWRFNDIQELFKEHGQRFNFKKLEVRCFQGNLWYTYKGRTAITIPVLENENMVACSTKEI